MPGPDFSALRKDLLQAGIAPGHVRRTIAELNDHFDDIVAAGISEGHSRADAELEALRALGQLSNVADAMREQPELKSWAWHFPRLALVIYPLACVAALPAVPLIAGAQNATKLARWLACLLLGGFVTALMFLLLQLSITLT